MRVYHVTSAKRLLKYINMRYIKPPVRAWKELSDAERFAKSTGRTIILILFFDEERVRTLNGHRGRAVYINDFYPVSKIGFSDELLRRWCL